MPGHSVPTGDLFPDWLSNVLLSSWCTKNRYQYTTRTVDKLLLPQVGYLCVCKSFAQTMQTRTQLVEWCIPTPGVCGSNTVIRKIYIEHCFLSTVSKRRK